MDTFEGLETVKSIQFRLIKEYVSKTRTESPFAKVVSIEPNYLSESEFRAKLPLWFALLKMEEERKSEKEM